MDEHGRVKHLITLALGLIGVRLNLFQVLDIISLIPGITRHLKLLSSGKADHTDYSPIIFLVLFLLLSVFLSRTHPHVHSLSLSFFFSFSCIFFSYTQICTSQTTLCCEPRSEDEAAMENIYSWVLNGLVPILLWRRSGWMMSTCLKPDYSTSFWSVLLFLTPCRISLIHFPSL